jgi:hypothetical protein
VHRDGDVVPLGGHEVVAQRRRRAVGDGVHHPVDASPTLRDGLTGAHEVLGHGDVELEHVDLAIELAGRARRQAQAASGSGEDDRGALGLGHPGDREGERGVGEDAGDHDVLAVEETHDRRR